MANRENHETTSPVKPPGLPAKIVAGQEAGTIAAMASSALAARIPSRDLQVVIHEIEQEAQLLAVEDPDKARYDFQMGGKRIVGIAAPLAKVIAARRGGFFVAVSIDAEDDDFWTLRANIVDTTVPTWWSSVIRQRKCLPGGRFDGDHWCSNSTSARLEKDRVLQNQFEIGVSKVIRNAIEDLCPGLCRRALRVASETIEAKRARRRTQPTNKPKPADIKKLLARATAQGADIEAIHRWVGKPSREMTFDDFDRLRDMVAAIEAGEISATAAFDVGADGAAGNEKGAGNNESA